MMDAIRSLLFVPGDSERKIAKAAASDADALILDLEDAVAPANKVAARAVCREAVAAHPGRTIVVRINALDTAEALGDLAAVVRARPAGIMLPKCRSQDDLVTLDRCLGALEARDDVPVGSIRVLAIGTETGASVLGLAGYATGIPRLAGILWGAEDLAADVGAMSNKDAYGRYTPPFELARSMCLFAAASARVAPIDAVYTDFRDPVGLRRETQEAARDGFTAKAAIHPDQIAIINDVFTPSADAVERARRIVDLFAADPGAGVIALDGRMLDRPHFLQARRILARAGLNP